jgi:hypothetical protein
MKHSLATLLVAALTLLCATASADDKNVITLKRVDVVGTARRPAVVIEVTKARMQLSATTPTLAAGKIQDAGKKAPF